MTWTVRPLGGLRPPWLSYATQWALFMLPTVILASVLTRDLTPILAVLAVLAIILLCLMQDVRAAFHWRHGHDTGRYETLIEMIEATGNGITPNEWLLRELMFGTSSGLYTDRLRDMTREAGEQPPDEN